jgi:hypothetical protein
MNPRPAQTPHADEHQALTEPWVFDDENGALHVVGDVDLDTAMQLMDQHAASHGLFHQDGAPPGLFLTDPWTRGELQVGWFEELPDNIDHQFFESDSSNPAAVRITTWAPPRTAGTESRR